MNQAPLFNFINVHHLIKNFPTFDFKFEANDNISNVHTYQTHKYTPPFPYVDLHALLLLVQTDLAKYECPVLLC